jgi:hypothetical protein
VTDHHDKDLLQETFAAHEHLAPDSADVYTRVQEIAKGYRLRRIGLQAAGGAVLTAGLVAGAIQLPNFLPGHQSSGNGTGLVAPAASTSTASEKAALEAYSKAGYGYADAIKLAMIWKKEADATDPYTIKVEAGRRLLAGEKLPFTPLPEETGSGGLQLSKADQAALDEFFKQGYGYGDALRLMKIWKLKGDAYDGKIAGGKALLAGQTLPIKHQEDPPVDAEPPTSAADNKAFDAFFNAGYDYYDALKLAKIWKMDKNDLGAVKLAAGKKLLAHKKLPIKP